MMTIQERQKRAMIKKRKQIAKRRMILLLAALFVITLGSVVFGTIFSKAKNPSADIVQYKYYKSIEIKKGDSLWSIANEYCEDTYYDSIKDYVEELREINNLKSEKIHYGQRLIVAYYDCEFK